MFYHHCQVTAIVVLLVVYLLSSPLSSV